MNPPATNTRPSVNAVAVCAARLTCMAAVEINVPRGCCSRTSALGAMPVKRPKLHDAAAAISGAPTKIFQSISCLLEDRTSAAMREFRSA
jgi:hypothetical protein